MDIHGDSWLLERAMFLIPLIMSLTVHEWAHAWCAWKLGDDTARRLGRLTLSPLAHMDPIGTLLLPVLGVPIGWAKPVPFNPVRFRRRISIRMGILLTAAAGPISNLVLAAVCLLMLAAMGLLGIDPGGTGPISVLLHTLVFLNIALAIFNLLPIPPLDGSRIVDSLMPERFRGGWERFCGIGPAALVALVVTAYVTWMWFVL